MSKVHMTEEGSKPCKASIRECKYGEHFDSMSEGEKAFAQRNKEKFGAVNTFTKKSDPIKKLEENAQSLSKEIHEKLNGENSARNIVDTVTLNILKSKMNNLSKEIDGVYKEIERLNDDGDERLLGGASAYEANVNHMKELDSKFEAIEQQALEIESEMNYRKTTGNSYVKRSLSEADKVEVSSMIDRKDPEWAEYYKATDEKHFTNLSAPGSKFTDRSLHKVEDVLELAIKQRGNLDGDDKEKFIAQGSSPDTFRESNRYLMIKTPGRLGVQALSEMKDDELLEVTRTKPGVPCNIVKPVNRSEAQNLTTDTAVAVVTNDQDTGKPILITTFPGIVTKNVKSDELDTLEGQKITVARARELLGNNAYANTRVVE